MPEHAPAEHHPANVRFTNVSLVVDQKLLIDNISCTLDGHGITVVLGPNGAGKSLFLRLLAGIISPTSGAIEFDDKCGQDSQALVFQNPVLLRRSTFENLAFVLRQQKLPSGDLRRKVMVSLTNARLEKLAKTPARKLSGGEQQRLALARALVVDPATLLLDEPTASLDPGSTFAIEETILAANKNGTKIVLVTHDIKQAKRLADDVMFIDGGRMIAQKPAAAFFENPGSEAAQCYLDGRLPV